MNNFVFITPQEAVDMDAHHNKADIHYYEELLTHNEECSNCDQPVWKLGDTGMCFSCTTGETDASEDYELH